MSISNKISFRKLISAVLVLVMLVGFCAPLTAITASAAAPTSYTDITSGSTASVNINSSGSSRYFRFVPTQNGTYNFYSSNNSGDPYGYLLDAYGEVLVSNDDGAGNGGNFLISYSCTANTVYYVRAAMCGGSTGSYTLNVTREASNSTDPLVTTAGTNTYALFNSGRGGSGYSSSVNPGSFTNGGYDIYVGSLGSSRLGLGFTVEQEVIERAIVTIYAYDVDEGAGERDIIYLVDETDGSETQLSGYLSGMDSQWNTTTMYIDAAHFEVGHTYHLKLREAVSGWVVYVRTASIQLTTYGEQVIDPVTPTITEHSLSASISNSGYVTTSLFLKSNLDVSYTLEYAATIGGDQRGSSLNQSVTVTPDGVTKNVSFSLESGAPAGSYQINVTVKDASGNPVATYFTTAGYSYKAVSYNSNGGSNNVPIDTSNYSSGNTVSVLFNYIPSRYGYTFLGWATSSTATVPEFTENGNNTFTMGSGDVTLYAVWKADACEHTETELIVEIEPDCTTRGMGHTVCSDCGETVSTNDYVSALGHSYEITSSTGATCTVDGETVMTCSVCQAEKRQITYAAGHSFGGDNVCDGCGFEVEAHTHDYSESTIQATCTTVGYTVYTCPCGYSYRQDYTDQLGHRWDNGVTTAPATCTESGEMLYSCTECTATYTEIIPAAHSWTENVTTPATCTTDGELERTCSVCGEEETVVIPAAHDWVEVSVITPATCTGEGETEYTCNSCGTTDTMATDVLGHRFENGACVRCAATITDVVTPDSDHPEYGMYFEIDDIISNYGPDFINEYGVLLDFNDGANIKKVAVFLVQDGTMWRRCIACVGEGITYATYVPYLSYDEDIKYTGLNSEWINVFNLSENGQGIWCYSDFATIGVNLQDRNGNLLLSLYDIGQAGAKTRVFDDLDEMIAWLTEDSDCITHTEGSWILGAPATVTSTGYRYTECTACGIMVSRELIPTLAVSEIEDVCTKAGATVDVYITIQNNPGITGAVFTLNYDPALRLVDAKAGGALGTLNLTLPGFYENGCRFVFDGAGTDDASNGTILILTFEVPADASVATVYNVELSFSSGDIINESGESVELEIASGQITVEELTGDVNDDGVVDVRDVIALRRYLSSGYEVTVDEAGADINGDGEISVADIVELRRYLVNG